MTRLARWVFWAVIAACAGFCLATSVETPSTALVVVAGKSWSWKSKQLTRAEAVPVGAELEQSGTQDPDLVLGCGRLGWLSYSCSKATCTVKACQGKDANVEVHRVDLATHNEPAPEHSEEGWLASLFKREPAALAVLGVREGGHVTDAVVRGTPTDVYLGPAFPRVLEGKYCLRLTPLPPGDSSQARTVVIDWDRSVDPDGRVTLANLQSGLYTLEKSDSEAAGACTFSSDSTKAWILVAPESDFGTLSATWKDYSSEMRAIEQRDGASPTVLLSVRHAALAHLSDSMAEGK